MPTSIPLGEITEVRPRQFGPPDVHAVRSVLRNTLSVELSGGELVKHGCPATSSFFSSSNAKSFCIKIAGYFTSGWSKPSRAFKGAIVGRSLAVAAVILLDSRWRYAGHIYVWPSSAFPDTLEAIGIRSSRDLEQYAAHLSRLRSLGESIEQEADWYNERWGVGPKL